MYNNLYLTHKQNAIWETPQKAFLYSQLNKVIMNTSTKVQEIFKDIPNFEGVYQISNLGRVKSLSRTCFDGRKVRERFLKPSKNARRYLTVRLCKNGLPNTFQVHQLVAMAFLNHVPCGFKRVVNHINFNISDNRLENIEVVTNRQNCNQKHLKSSSKYVGVYYKKELDKWRAQIQINRKSVHLGYYNNEYDAHLAYQRKLKELEE
jgi:hypothetical protein